MGFWDSFVSIISAPAAIVDDLTKPITNQVTKILPDSVKPFVQNRGSHITDVFTKPGKAYRTSLGNITNFYDDVTGKVDARKKAAAEAAAAKAQNDALLGELESQATNQANTKNFNDSALAAARQAQLAARAAQSSRASRARSRRSTVLADSPAGNSIGGVKGYGTLLGGGN